MALREYYNDILGLSLYLIDIVISFCKQLRNLQCILYYVLYVHIFFVFARNLNNMFIVESWADVD